jgi:hypothetical protein
MTDDRLDLSPLDPTRDPIRFDAAVSRIMDRSTPARARRRARTTAIGQITTWWRPMLALAAAVALAAVGVLTQVKPAPSATVVRRTGLAEAIGIPSSIAPWLGATESPTAAQVFSALRAVQ